MASGVAVCGVCARGEVTGFRQVREVVNPVMRHYKKEWGGVLTEPDKTLEAYLP